MLDTKQPMSLELSTNVIQFITMWMSELPDMTKLHKEKNQSLDLFEKINNLLSRMNAYNPVEDRIVFLSIVYKDIV
jgi:hypothetical protein